MKMGRTIGLLEDNAAIVEVFSIALRARGYTVESHATGQSLLDACFEGDKICIPLPYDLLLCDRGLPGNISGVETLLILYQHVAPTNLPAILISGADARILEDAQRKLPSAFVLKKPIGPRALWHMVETVMASLSKEEA